jgi:hypothetical protein
MAGPWFQTGFQVGFQLQGGLVAVRKRFAVLTGARDAPVVANALMENLVSEYGEVRGRDVYFAMEREAKGPFAPGNKYDAAERPPQPVVVRMQPAPPPQSPAKRQDADALKRFVREAVTKTGWRE